MSLPAPRLSRLRRRAFGLEYATMTWMVAEAAIAITAAATLLGVALSTGPGWWWADPAGALVIAVLAAREGIESWHEEQES